ncbi:MAG: ABC transporter substrate-binding protein, partial [Anaerolineales bacterium]|nr:ABC transporter substrate-binding protein [Anaerolineales bacterium]
FLETLAAALIAAAGLAACGGGRAPASLSEIRVGYFPNITHSQALIGMARGDFQQALGEGISIKATQFNAGPSVIEAMFAGELDLAYIGPNPAINGYVRSGGEALRIVAGATSAGASLIVRPEAGITRPEDLDGKRIASPQLGNTQDVALRAYLADHGLLPAERGGTVQVLPTKNPEILDLFRLGRIDGAWVPEPWATRLIVEGGGQLFLDERDLWPNGDFTTAMVIVSTSFLNEHPDAVRAWLEAHVDVTQWTLENPAEARQILNQEIENLTGQALPAEVLEGASSRMRITYDPISASLVQSANAAFQAGFLDSEPNLEGIYDLGLLNQVLRAHGLAPVE